jgi:SPP1 family predicted phage head-tail adaptor
VTDRIGELDQLVTLQARTETEDSGGGITVAWANFATDASVWADPQPLYGKEAIEDGAFNASGAWLFRIRYRGDVTERDRIMWNGEPYNITRIMRRGGREQYLMIEAARGVAQ